MSKSYRLLGADGVVYQSETPGTLGGHRLHKIYGRFDCPSANSALKRGHYVKHRVFFASEDDAISAGYRPCGKCLKELYARWKAGGEPGSPGYPWFLTP